MKPPFSASEFIRRAREAQHDSLGLEQDLESTVSLANVARMRFFSQPTPDALSAWETLVDEAGDRVDNEGDVATRRWLAVESIRLGAVRKMLGIVNESVHERSGRWAVALGADERHEIVRTVHLEGVLVTVAAAVSKG